MEATREVDGMLKLQFCVHKKGFGCVGKSFNQKQVMEMFGSV